MLYIDKRKVTSHQAHANNCCNTEMSHDPSVSTLWLGYTRFQEHLDMVHEMSFVRLDNMIMNI